MRHDVGSAVPQNFKSLIGTDLKGSEDSVFSKGGKEIDDVFARGCSDRSFALLVRKQLGECFLHRGIGRNRNGFSVFQRNSNV